MKNLTKRWRGLGIVLAVVVLAAVALAACGSKSQSTTTSSAGSSPKAGGTYNYPLDGEPVGIAPITQQESIGYNVVHADLRGPVSQYDAAARRLHEDRARTSPRASR